MRNLGLVGLISALLPTVALGAIKYTINSPTPVFTLPGSGIISVGSFNTDTLVHIFDDDGSGIDDDAPAIEVQGTSSSGAKLFVQVCASNEPNVFRRTPTRPS